LDDRVPDGDDDKQNELVYEWGDKTTMPAIAKQSWRQDFTPLWHDDVATKLAGYRQDAAVQMSGTRFIALSGSIARLERALGMFFMDLHTDQHGYTEVTVPYVVSRTALEGTSQLPKFEEDLFAITRQSHTCNGQDAFLIPTAEVPVTNLHRDSVLEEADLPLSYVAWTPCFRAEAGSYGRDTKGLVRTHQFHKVELVKITTAETSDTEHEILTEHAEACLRALELPYRKMRLSSGDIGFAARHCYDLEVWLPGANEYREISSCSNTGDFQARRMALRYRPKPMVGVEGDASTSAAANKGSKAKTAAAKRPKPALCHTINGSGLAVGRTLVAVLENYQQPDGTVIVPTVLRPYMGGKEVLSLATE
jgi:seryl-tRNA synthetase